MTKCILMSTAATAALLIAGPAAAQTTAGGQAADTADLGLAEIVVTARKRAENVQDVPVAVTALSAETLAELEVNDIRDVARVTPGLVTTQSTVDRNGISVSIRGQANVITPDGSVGTYLDGVNIPFPFGVSPTLIDLEQVEVLRGSQGTLYGRNTTGGAVKFTTRAPSLDKVGGFVTLKAGRFDRIDVSAAIDLPIVEDRLGIRLLGNHAEQSGTGRDGLGTDVNDDNTDYYRGRLTWKPGPSFQADLTVDYTNLRDHGRAARITSTNGFPPGPGLGFAQATLFEIAAESGLITFDPEDPANEPLVIDALASAQAILDGYTNSAGPGTGFYDSASTFPQLNKLEMVSVALNLVYDISDQWQIKSTSGYRKLDRLSFADFDATPFSILESEQFIKDEFYSQELQLTYSGDRLNVVAGLYGSKEDGQDGSSSVAFPVLAGPDPFFQNILYKNSSWSIYGQGDYRLTDRLTITLGGRWTEETKEGRFIPAAPGADSLKKTYSGFSYLAGLDFKISDDLLVYGKLGRGFRGGGINSPDDTGAITDYRPETTREFEVGFKSELWDRRVRLNAAAYHTKYSDIQRVVLNSSADCDPDPLVTAPCTFQTTQNAAKATIQGVELEIAAQLAPGLSFGGSLGYIDAKYDVFTDASGDRSGEPFPTPEFTYSLNARYAHPLTFGQVVARLDYNWVDDQVYRPQANFDPGVTQKAYGILNGRLSLEFDDLNAEVAIFGRNLTGKKYLASVLNLDDDTFGYNLGFQGERRTFGIEFTKRFGGG